MSNPNRKERLTPLNPVSRSPETGNSGNAARDGFTVTARRPRGGFFTEIEEAKSADRNEGIFSDLGPMPDDGDYDD